MDLFSTDVLTGVAENLKRTPANGVLQRYFGRTEQHETEEIHFDQDDRRRRIAPFVHPLVAGKVVQGRGQQVATFKPAYVKDKRVFDSTRPLKRIAGEPLTGVLAPMARQQALVAQEVDDMSDMLDRRLEVMAMVILLTGSLTIVGEDYPSATVDFNRHADLEPTDLSGAALWTASTADPLGNLQTWALVIAQISGAQPIDVVMAVDAWAAFRKHASVKDALDVRNVRGNEVSTVAQTTEGLSFKGTVDGFNIFSYAGWYVDPADNTEKAIMDAGHVVMSGPDLQGVQAFGAIRDERAGFRATRLFVKSWLEEDPPVRYVMGQSAPLLVPERVNASLALKVI
jgi:hypothetical protein